MKFYLILFLVGFVGFSAKASAFELLHQEYGRELFFVFDGGSKDGIVKGMTACVYDEDEELFCGKINEVNQTRSGVFSPPDKEAWLEPGAYVRVKELGEIAANSPRSAVHATYKSDKTVERDSSWHADYVMTPVLPFQYTHADFSIDARMNGSGSLWAPSVPVRQSFVGASTAYRTPLSFNLDHQFGFMWRFVAPVYKEVDFDPNSGDIYTQEKSKLSDIAFSWSVVSISRSNGVRPGWLAGIAIDQANLSYSSDIAGDTTGSQGGSLAASKASLLGVSLKLGGRVETGWGKSTATGKTGLAGIGVSAAVPVYAKTTWSHGDHNMPEDVIQASDSKTQLEEATKFSKARVGVESNIYVGWMF